MTTKIGKFVRSLDGDGDAPVTDESGKCVAHLWRWTDNVSGNLNTFRVCAYEVEWEDDSGGADFSVREHGSAAKAKAAALKWIDKTITEATR